MKKLVSLITIMLMLISFQNLNAQKRYSGKRHSSSHSGTYKGGKGSSHKGGTYKNTRTGNRYGKHKY
ncbi:hypothetical protein M2347_000046 [Chryseobacterium sp. H1D6B]|uniref:hypothetical protein n=1 Tax=Chryseobacterium sp. H1D6B TaxID=2940588 RepID=UPI0015CA1CD9|nr:hypothetical protein [Chryseobacterium sp. H1D6B]MDH6250319.1 hypothetical protein [Chryseobacterium sp. H1D6B]